MKSIIMAAVYRTVRSPSWYSHFWHRIARLSQLATCEHELQSLVLNEDFASISGSLMQSNVVAAGPFAGMIYPQSVASGSALLPKLLGCYEQELHLIIEQMMDRRYSFVIDIGCAEGYYAVGFAMKKLDVKVLAFDTDPQALERCRNMAEANGVASRIDLFSVCTRDQLVNLSQEYGLIICDCEGYEDRLFDGGATGALNRCDLLIEVHEFIRPFVLSKLRRELAKTHHVVSIHSIHDFARPQVFPQAKLQEYQRDIQIALMRESRPSVMTWLWCNPIGMRHPS